MGHAKPGSDNGLSATRRNAEAYHGRLQKAREINRRAVDSAVRSDLKEAAASYEADAAVREAEFGDAAAARRKAAAAAALFPAEQNVRISSALGSNR